jgi:hypothetical protein
VTQENRNVKHRKTNESIIAFKKELKAISFEPIYGKGVKDIITRLTVELEKIATEYGYEIEFPEKAKTEIEADVYYFDYEIKIKTKLSIKKMRLQVQFINGAYEDGGWTGMITAVE